MNFDDFVNFFLAETFANLVNFLIRSNLSSLWIVFRPSIVNAIDDVDSIKNVAC